MTQAAHAIAYNVSKALRYRERIVFTLIALVFVFASAYVYFVRQAIVNVVTRGAIVKAMQVKNAHSAALENQYFALKNSINLDTAASMGFSPVVVTAFIPAQTSVAISSHNEI